MLGGENPRNTLRGFRQHPWLMMATSITMPAAWWEFLFYDEAQESIVNRKRERSERAAQPN